MAQVPKVPVFENVPLLYTYLTDSSWLLPHKYFQTFDPLPSH